MERKRKKLESKINTMDYKIRHSPERITRKVLEQFADLNKQLEEIRTNKIKGTILRLKAKWIDEGG